MPGKKNRAGVTRRVANARVDRSIELPLAVAAAIVASAVNRASAFAGALGPAALKSPETIARIESAVALSAHADAMRARMLAGDRNPWLREQIAHADALASAVFGMERQNHP